MASRREKIQKGAEDRNKIYMQRAQEAMGNLMDLITGGDKDKDKDEDEKKKKGKSGGGPRMNKKGADAMKREFGGK